MGKSKLHDLLRRGRVVHYSPDKPAINKIGIEINKHGYRIKDASRFLPYGSSRGERKPITRFTGASKRRLVRLCANNSDIFKYFVTLTYHEIVQDGLMVKKHLNRFLTMLRKVGLEKYIWALEFQKRGSIHLHMWMGEHVLEGRWRDDMPKLRARLLRSCEDEGVRRQAMVVQYLWLKSSGQLDDEKAQKAAVDYQVLRAPHAVKIYAIKYGAKLLQKRLPEGVKSVGRWWGASRKVVNDKLFVAHGDERAYKYLAEFCDTFSFPKQGAVVAECEPAEEVWLSFLDGFMKGNE